MPLRPYINISCKPASVSPRLSRRAATPTCPRGARKPQHSSAQPSTAQHSKDQMNGWAQTNHTTPQHSAAQHRSGEQDLWGTPCWKHAGVYAWGHVKSLSQWAWVKLYTWPQACTSLEYVQANWARANHKKSILSQCQPHAWGHEDSLSRHVQAN